MLTLAVGFSWGESAPIELRIGSRRCQPFHHIAAATFGNAIAGFAVIHGSANMDVWRRDVTDVLRFQEHSSHHAYLTIRPLPKPYRGHCRSDGYRDPSALGGDISLDSGIGGALGFFEGLSQQVESAPANASGDYGKTSHNPLRPSVSKENVVIRANGVASLMTRIEPTK
jgi:hypothetical protein